MLNGTDLTPIRDDVTRILSSHEDKARIVAALVQNHDYHRINLLLQMRAEQEKRLWRASRRGDLSTPESLAFFRMATGEINRITETLRDNKATINITDGSAMVDKVDTTRRDTDKQLIEAYSTTTPHGREIIRKRLYDMKKAVMAKTQDTPDSSSTPAA